MPENPLPQPRDIDAKDILIISGALSIVAGVAFIYWPASLIVFGLECFFAVYLANRNS